MSPDAGKAAVLTTSALAAAAAQWNVAPDSLRTQNGVVIGPRGKKLSYGELAEAATRPQVNAALDATRQKYTNNGAVPPPLAGTIRESGTAQLTASWELDFFGKNRAAIHQNHGHFTVGASVDEAVFWYVCFERCAQAQLLAMAAGTPKIGRAHV